MTKVYSLHTPKHLPPKPIEAPAQALHQILPDQLTKQRSLVTPKEVLDMDWAGATIPIVAPPYPHSLNSIKKTTTHSL